MTRDPDELAAALRGPGFAFVTGDVMARWLGPVPDAFVASWDDLAVDPYMADGGRYRRRRHARYAADAGGIRRLPHGPHYQTLDYNPLHGGIERWFEPIVVESAFLDGVLAWGHQVFDRAASRPAAWFVEVHQFRIEARLDEPGNPTPEGPHRDGVDYVLVLLVRRANIASGTTRIYAPDGRELGSFTLAAPLDAAVLHDPRVFHGVTAVEPVDPAKPAARDVLVVTFKVASARADDR